MSLFPQLDVKIKKIDPAWPVTHPKPAPSAPVPIDRSASNTKIHVNPNFVSKTVKEKTPPMEDETERMRAELLKKEAELIKLKQMQLDMQILQLKKEMPGQKPVTDGSTISSTTSGLTPERKSPPNSSSALPLPQAEKNKKVRCLLREANISYSIQIINRELINGLSHHSDLRFDISPPVIQSLARLILKLDRGPCFHERNTLSDNNELFLKWIHVIPLTA